MWETDINRLSFHAKLVPKLPLAPQHMALDASVRFTQELHRGLARLRVLRGLQLGCGCRAERQTLCTVISQGVDGGRDEPFGEVLRCVFGSERVLDRPSSCNLREKEEADDIVLFVDGVEVFAMCWVSPGLDIRDMYLISRK